MALLRSLGSKHTRIEPLDFGVTTAELIHGVYLSFTSFRIPSSTRRASSFCRPVAGVQAPVVEDAELVWHPGLAQCDTLGQESTQYP